ncbi:hypothetical protein A6769_07805 [Nostoc punctiforme NIES-2108]|uniref:Uncharacterized protein n=1 Tax=Nostoc punctiforme NIES-2108 TaxID=1356359 RepID=A0A367RR12_NOSPU|nr:hypothetical protein A6769_07805 [Nostoc punctiforme NIES-2108]
MSDFNNQKLNLKFHQLRLVPYLTIGSLIFYFNSNLDLNYIVKGYLVLMECQLGIIFIYFLTAKITNKTHK